MADEPTSAWAPTFPIVRRIDALWHQGERLLCGMIFLVMALMVFASVVTETFGNRRHVSDVVILAGLCLMAVRTRAVKEGETPWSWPASLGIAAIATVVIAGSVYLYTERFAGGFIWAQKLALVMMIWVALLGASMATYDRSHLALEFGEKIWPARVRPYIQALALAVASAFCAAALLLAVDLVTHQRHEGLRVDANRWLPTWAAFVIVPYAFGAMAIRLLAQATTTATGKAEPVEERLPS
ncbi:MAG: TRAP transporter small permease [Myxococcales bacterium]|nr:TRAP transporter small permease [Myxococcales bacterium]